MYSKATVFGHSLHPILVSFPLTFYSSMLVGYLAYVATGKTICFQVAVAANLAGVVSAVLATIPGFVDWQWGLPGGHPAKGPGLVHMALNTTALFFATVAAIVEIPQWSDVGPTAGLAIVLSIGVLTLTVLAGHVGGRLVRHHHVGIDVTAEQNRIDVARMAAGRGSPTVPRALRVSQAESQ